MPNKVVGGCHCGNIRFTLRGDVPVTDWAARFCGCGFCTRHGGLYASHPSAELEVSIYDSDELGIYRFATASADFCFCRKCGVLTYLTCEIDGALLGLVNMNTLDERPAAFTRAPVMSYEGEDEDARIARRKKNWIPKVTIRLTSRDRPVD